MKLSAYAKKKGISYLTAFRHWQKGYIKGEKLASGTIVVYDEATTVHKENLTILYARVSSSQNKTNLESQLTRLREFANAKGYKVVKEVKEIGSGLNDKRPMLEKVLASDDWNILLAEHKDRVARFGLNYLNVLLPKQGKQIEIINNVLEDKEDLMQDFVELITSFTARLYGLRRNKRRTEKLIKELQEAAKNAIS